MLDNPTFEAPNFVVDPSVTDFDAFTKDSFKMVDYQCNKFDYEIPIAI
jgi:thymidylate synthase